jgi:hypothetical protein
VTDENGRPPGTNRGTGQQQIAAIINATVRSVPPTGENVAQDAARVCRPGGAAESGPASSRRNELSVDAWHDAYVSALRWVMWTGRKRWPDAATNDLVWAMSITEWWLGPGAGGRDG